MASAKYSARAVKEIARLRGSRNGALLELEGGARTGIDITLPPALNRGRAAGKDDIPICDRHGGGDVLEIDVVENEGARKRSGRLAVLDENWGVDDRRIDNRDRADSLAGGA